MNGFHIDMNVAQFTRSYLEKWLRELASLGYDTILWEVENNIRWETCPECVSPDAFSKEEFKDVLKLCDSLGLESIPLFQILGHCEYVLKHEPYKHLAESPTRIDQYCPRNPKVVSFLTRWIDEYLELFGNVKRFHLGGDEAYLLGKCDQCRTFVEQTSVSDLYIDHINLISAPLLARNIQPIIWGDMVLHHPQALSKLSRKIMIFDWMYDISRGNGKVWVWGKDMQRKEDFDPETRNLFGKFLFPDGDEPGREPETFYTADYLAANGFDVVTSPASSCYGDNVFTPRNYYHLANTFDSFQKGRQSHLKGSVLTSWTVHLFPYELQLTSIDVPAFLRAYPEKPITEYPRYFTENRFKTNDMTFFQACGLLSKNCLFSHAATMGYYKDCQKVPLDYVDTTLDQLAKEGKLEAQLQNAQDRLKEYTQGLYLLEQFTSRVNEGKEYLACWNLAARNLINRARIDEFILKNKLSASNNATSDPVFKNEGKKLLEQMRDLREETRKMYEPILKPSRRQEVIDWIYSSLEHTLAALIGESKDSQ